MKMLKFWDRLDERVQENATGILGTIAFHMFLILIFLIIKISTERNRLENLILVDFDEQEMEELIERVAPDPEFEEKLADFLSRPASNIPVNVARQVDEELSTEKYVEELEKDLDASRDKEYQDMQERLRELEELEQEEISLEGDETESEPPEPYVGPTNIIYELAGRYHMRLPVPVYKCEGGGLIEVKIAVDQSGRVVQVETETKGETVNDICFAEAAKNAALKTRFNRDNNAPVRQIGSITYHFVPQ